MAVPGAICEKEIFYIPIWHHFKYQACLQIRPPIGQLFWKGPVLLHLDGNFHTIDVDDLSSFSFTDLTLSARML